MEKIIIKYLRLKYPEAKQFFRTNNWPVLYLGNSAFYDNNMFLRDNTKIIMELFGINRYFTRKYIIKWFDSLEKGNGVIGYFA